MGRITDKMRTALEGPDFYGLMQSYRHAPLTSQVITSGAFECVKVYILKNILEAETSTDDEPLQESG